MEEFVPVDLECRAGEHLKRALENFFVRNGVRLHLTAYHSKAAQNLKGYPDLNDRYYIHVSSPHPKRLLLKKELGWTVRDRLSGK